MISLKPIVGMIAGSIVGVAIGVIAHYLGAPEWSLKFFPLAGMAEGFREGHMWNERSKARMPQNQKRKGGPILPNATKRLPPK